ncbi:hypothetical protein BH24CHL7_BH24CHL7_00920 [soil metagenome]
MPSPEIPRPGYPASSPHPQPAAGARGAVPVMRQRAAPWKLRLAVMLSATLGLLGCAAPVSPTTPPSAAPTAGSSIAGSAAPTELAAEPSSEPGVPSTNPGAPSLPPNASPQLTAQPPPASPEVKEAPPTSLPPEELTGYVWPLRDARITSRFAPRGFGGFVVIDGDEIHDGLDLATYCGNKVRAAHDGTVLYAGRRFDDYMGYLGSGRAIYQRLERQGRINTLPIVVIIDDGNGYRSTYVHLSRADVEAGAEVRAGEVIGREGMTGYSTGCHLHYGLVRMDGPWQVVVPQLHPFGYPAFVRERVDPLRVLPKDHPDAPARLRNRFASPSPEPADTASPTAVPSP